MEIKRRHWSPVAQSSNHKKMKITAHDIISIYPNESRNVSKLVKNIKSRYVSKYPNESRNVSTLARNCKSLNVSKYPNESRRFDHTDMNVKMENSHLPLKIMCSVKEERRNPRERREVTERKAVEIAEIEALVAGERARGEYRKWVTKEEEFYYEQVKDKAQKGLCEDRFKLINLLSLHLDEPDLVFEILAVKDMEDLCEEIKVHLAFGREIPSRICYLKALLVVCDWELAKARKKEALARARLRGEQLPAESLDEERGLHSSIEAEVKSFLQGKSRSELEVLQSEIKLQILRSGSAKEVEYWETILKFIHFYVAKACLKEEYHAKILRMNLEKIHRGIRYQDQVDAGYDQKNYLMETEEAEGTGSSCSPELLFGEETGDNFEMMTMGDTGEGDELSGNNDEVILQCQYTCRLGCNKCRPRNFKYFNRVHNEHEGKNCT